MYDTTINVEQTHNKRDVFFNKQGDEKKGRPQDHRIQQPKHKTRR